MERFLRTVLAQRYGSQESAPGADASGAAWDACRAGVLFDPHAL
jgi:hypothetical protein